MAEDKNKIYVGNLEYGVTSEELKTYLDEKGIVTLDVVVITDKYTGRSKGFGFAEVATDEEIDKAVEALDGQDMKGRKLKISKARKPKPRF